MGIASATSAELGLINMIARNSLLVLVVAVVSIVNGSYLSKASKQTPAKNCRTEYETVTSYEQQCSHSYEKECNPVQLQECSPRVEEIFNAQTAKECRTSFEEQCTKEHQNHCAIF